MLTSEELYNKANSAVGRFDTVLADVQAQKGTLGKFVYDPQGYEQAKQFFERGNALLADVKAGKGTAGKFITDDALYTKWRNTGENLEQATAKLSSNTGTAGKLFSDPQFYDNVSGLAGDMRLLVGEFRQNPKKFLHVKFSIF
jgi:phospholipid/cholesterol/gamma-HCH transport system substrate-binding protein